MPKQKSGTFDNKVYQNEYHKGMKTKLISFNPNSPEDMEIWDFLIEKGKGNVTPYIKGLIRDDMNQENREKAIFKEIYDFIQGPCSTDTYEDKDYVCHEIQKMFARNLGLNDFCADGERRN